MPAPMPKPLLLLDIGGVICTQGSPDSVDFVEIAGATRALAPAIEERLHDLLAHFELAWASAWGDEANVELGPRLGLPALEHVRFLEEDEFGASYKLAGVRAFVGERPAAWVDDDLGADCREWARGRKQPTLLVETDAQVGLTGEDVEELLSFGQGPGSPSQIQG